jgi:hypothetical protein
MSSSVLGANGEESIAIPCSVSFFKAKLLRCALSDHSEVDDAHISGKVFIPIMHINAYAVRPNRAQEFWISSRQTNGCVDFRPLFSFKTSLAIVMCTTFIFQYYYATGAYNCELLVGRLT